jgi:hypothetical protein
MDTTENEVISRLKFIGKIQQGDKINVKYMYIQPDTFFTKLSRTILNQDSRSNTLNFLRTTITTSFNLINKYNDLEKNDEYDKIILNQKCDNITEDLKKSMSGLICIKDTYLHDVKFICDIDTLLQDINLKISEIDIKKSSRT